ncbi:hypothetical protein GNF77_17805 [Clostridium perfringens]|uniref:Uncharacterized protein n=1 Tax=Clostridium perfringens TaxID=1502 RepID=A0AAW9IM73_CLOPF|nr:hypothetical protein [Clostridium perfringens]MDZ5010714.1 hypothetical protein [Clostridium perfringens]
MSSLLKFIAGMGEITMFVTPLTLVIGIINAKKKPKGESKGYTIMAVISAYLIIVPLIWNS